MQCTCACAACALPSSCVHAYLGYLATPPFRTPCPLLKTRPTLCCPCRYDEDQAALRALRMALRDVLLRMLGSRKWEAYAEPVSPDEDPHYWNTVGWGDSW